MIKSRHWRRLASRTDSCTWPEVDATEKECREKETATAERSPGGIHTERSGVIEISPLVGRGDGKATYSGGRYATEVQTEGVIRSINPNAGAVSGVGSVLSTMGSLYWDPNDPPVDPAIVNKEASVGATLESFGETPSQITPNDNAIETVLLTRSRPAWTHDNEEEHRVTMQAWGDALCPRPCSTCAGADTPRVGGRRLDSILQDVGCDNPKPLVCLRMAELFYQYVQADRLKRRVFNLAIRCLVDAVGTEGRAWDVPHVRSVLEQGGQLRAGVGKGVASFLEHCSRVEWNYTECMPFSGSIDEWNSLLEVLSYPGLCHCSAVSAFRNIRTTSGAQVDFAKSLLSGCGKGISKAQVDQIYKAVYRHLLVKDESFTLSLTGWFARVTDPTTRGGIIGLVVTGGQQRSNSPLIEVVESILKKAGAISPSPDCIAGTTPRAHRRIFSAKIKEECFFMDIIVVKEEHAGYCSVFFTGPTSLLKKMSKRAQKMGVALPWKDAACPVFQFDDRECVDAPDEASVFSQLGMPFIPAHERGWCCLET